MSIESEVRAITNFPLSAETVALCRVMQKHLDAIAAQNKAASKSSITSEEIMLKIRLAEDCA